MQLQAVRSKLAANKEKLAEATFIATQSARERTLLEELRSLALAETSAASDTFDEGERRLLDRLDELQRELRGHHAANAKPSAEAPAYPGSDAHAHARSCVAGDDGDSMCDEELDKVFGITAELDEAAKVRRRKESRKSLQQQGYGVKKKVAFDKKTKEDIFHFKMV